MTDAEFDNLKPGITVWVPGTGGRGLDKAVVLSTRKYVSNGTGGLLRREVVLSEDFRVYESTFVFLSREEAVIGLPTFYRGWIEDSKRKLRSVIGSISFFQVQKETLRVQIANLEDSLRDLGIPTEEGGA